MAGLKAGDTIISVNNEKIRSWNEFASIIAEKPNEKVEIGLNDNRKISLTVAEKEVDDIFGDKEKIGYIGASLQIDAVIGEVMPSSIAESAGFLKNDKIISINGEKISSWTNSATYIRGNPGQELSVDVEREGKVINLKVTPEPKTQNIDGKETTMGQLLLWVWV